MNCGYLERDHCCHVRLLFSSILTQAYSCIVQLSRSCIVQLSRSFFRSCVWFLFSAVFRMIWTQRLTRHRVSIYQHFFPPLFVKCQNKQEVQNIVPTINQTKVGSLVQQSRDRDCWCHSFVRAGCFLVNRPRKYRCCLVLHDVEWMSYAINVLREYVRIMATQKTP